MSGRRCEFEDAVVDAVKSGDWTPELRAHRDGCLSCAELTLVVAALTADAEALVAPDTPLPDAGVIWLRSRLAVRERDVRRATRAITWVQRATVAVVAAIGLAFAPSLWSLLKRGLAALDLGTAAAGLPRAADSPILVLTACLVVLGWLAFSELSALPKN